MRLICLLVFLALSAMLTESSAQHSLTPPVTLNELLRANSHTISLSNGALSGDGMEMMMKAASSAQFFTLAEPHNAREVPEITSALLKALRERYGFNYLALEQDPVMAQMVSARSRAGIRDYTVSLARKYPKSFTFITDQEIEMIAQAASISTGKGDRVWGLDQIFGATHSLEQLLKYAPNAEARASTLKLIETAREYETGRSRGFMTDAARPDDFLSLAQIYKPRKGSEAEFLIDQLALSSRVYLNYKMAEEKNTGYESNYEREENMKFLFMRQYRKAKAAGEAAPKVIVKMGHYHLIRGRAWGGVLTLGNFLSEFAASNKASSFHLAVYNNNKSGFYGVMSSDADYKPLAEAAPFDKWTVIDFRPLRPLVFADKVQGINPELRRVIFGFDAALLIGGASRGTYELTKARQ